MGAKTLYIEPGSPWENGYCESFNGKLRDECLKGEIFYSLKEAQVVIRRSESAVQHGTAAFLAGLPATGAASPPLKEWGMEIWKTLRVSHISTPPTATTNYCLKRRYTNIPLGTKNRSGQHHTEFFKRALWLEFLPYVDKQLGELLSTPFAVAHRNHQVFRKQPGSHGIEL